MSRNGTGTYNLPAGNPVVTNTTISSTWANNTLTDLATAMTGSVAADGQTTLTGNLQMNNNKLTGLAVGTTAGDSVEFTQLAGILVSPTITGNLIVTGNGTFQGTGFVLVSKGTTAQRPAVPVNGQIRYNTDTAQFEGYQGGAWGQLGGGATGGGGDEVFVENGVTVTTDYTLTTNKNAESVGPITINATKTVTVPSGQRWVIL
jgi:hypothetical protein